MNFEEIIKRVEDLTLDELKEYVVAARRMSSYEYPEFNSEYSPGYVFIEFETGDIRVECNYYEDRDALIYESTQVDYPLFKENLMAIKSFAVASVHKMVKFLEDGENA